MNQTTTDSSAGASQVWGYEEHVFVERMGRTRPVVTRVLLVLLGLVFALELAWGGPNSTATLARMGAMERSRLFAGEWWRLMSSGVLHGSLIHFGLNAYVLWMLGLGTERLLGNARFVVLYVVSALVAALGSALVLGNLSVGASGAIWGLLGAQTVFVFGARGYVPAAARAVWQKDAALNLAINVAVSFTPHVDWAAHFAGGAAGAALVASGLLLRGVPKLDEADTRPGRRQPVRWLAAGLGALYVFGAATGVVAGKAWELRRPTEYVERALAELDASVSLPAPLGEGRLERTNGRPVYVFGDQAGPMMVFLQRIDIDPARFAAGLEREHAEVRRQLGEVGEGLELVGSPQTTERDGRLVTESRSRLPGGGVLDVAIVFESPYAWRVETLTWPDQLEEYFAAAQRIALSLKSSASGR